LTVLLFLHSRCCSTFVVLDRRSRHGGGHLISLLSFLNMKIMNVPRLTIPNANQQTDLNGKLALTVSAPYLEKQAQEFIHFINRVTREE